MAVTDARFQDRTGPHAESPHIRQIEMADLREALWQGWQDFKAQPSHLAFVALIYPIVGILLAQLTVSYNIFPLLFPLAAGFALLGPFAAIGLYEISRRREQGLDSSWRHVFDIRHHPSIGHILLLGALLTGLFIAWLFAAWAIYRFFLPIEAPSDTAAFLRVVFTTFEGWMMVLVGNAVGAIFAVLAFAISVVAFPYMLDRGVDMPTAVKASVEAVEENPREMLSWGIVVAGLLAIGSLPLLVGLVVVMPVLGHASWHLYRRVVES